VGNAWIVDGKVKYCADIDNLAADTLADRVKEAGGKVAIFSLKDRAALMMAGRTPDAISWYERKTGLWSEGSPEWMPKDAVEQVLTSSWQPLKPDLYASHFPDAQDHEELIEPMGGNTFPYTPPGTEHPSLYRVMPKSGTVLTDVAIAALDKLELGKDDTADLLVVSYSQTDYVGHAFTPQSWEAMDAMLVLDQDLERLFTALDERVGADRYTVVLSADHGAADANAKRVDETAMTLAATEAIKVLGLKAEAKFSDPFLFIEGELTDEDRAKAAAAAADAARAFDGIAAAHPWRAEGLPDDAVAKQQIEVALHPTRGGDVFILLEPQTLMAWQDSDRGTGHGSPWDHDTLVPLLMRGPGVVAQQGQRVDARAIAPTVAAMLGLEAPRDAELGVIPGALRAGK
jgi:hypothetical protein